MKRFGMWILAWTIGVVVLWNGWWSFAYAGPPSPSGEKQPVGETSRRVTETLVFDSVSEFAQGQLNQVAIQEPGTVLLEQAWSVGATVNDSGLSDARWWPRVVWHEASQSWLAVWADERQADHSPDIYLARSSDGRSWSTDILVDDACDPNEGPPYPLCPTHDNPDITVNNRDGSVWVVWSQKSADGLDAGDIYYALSKDNGDTWDQIGPIAEAAGKQHWPRLAISGDMVYAIWEDESSDAGDIRIARLLDPSSGWESSITVSDDTSGAEQYAPALAADGSGNLYAVWVDRRTDPNDGHVYFSHMPQGKPWTSSSWSAAIALSDLSVDWGLYPDVAVAPDGSIYAAWVERVQNFALADYRLVVARSTDQGQNWTRALVSVLENQSTGFYAEPDLGVGDGQRVMVTWLHSPDSQVSTSRVLVATSYDQGQHWSRPQQVDQESKVDVDSMPALAVNSAGQALIAWQDWRQGGLQIFAASHPAGVYVQSGVYMLTLAPGGKVAWNRLSWLGTTSSGGDLTLSTRVSLENGSGWSPWKIHATTPATLEHPDSPILQVRVAFTAAALGTASPRLEQIQVQYESKAGSGENVIHLPLIIDSP